MNPVFEQGKGQGIGYSYNMFYIIFYESVMTI